VPIHKTSSSALNKVDCPPESTTYLMDLVKAEPAEDSNMLL